MQGSVDEVRLILENGDDSKATSTTLDCLGHFKRIVDSCGGDNPVHNPHNYGFGGTVTTSDGWTCKLEPKAEKVTENSCDVSYSFVSQHIQDQGEESPRCETEREWGGFKGGNRRVWTAYGLEI